MTSKRHECSGAGATTEVCRLVESTNYKLFGFVTARAFLTECCRTLALDSIWRFRHSSRESLGRPPRGWYRAKAQAIVRPSFGLDKRAHQCQRFSAIESVRPQHLCGCHAPL